MRNGSEEYIVTADYDNEAKVWYVSSSNVPGLNTCAPTIDELRKKCTDLIPDLIDLNREPVLINNITISRPVPYDLLVKHAHA